MLHVAHITLSMMQGGIENLILSLCDGMDRTRFSFYIYCLDSGGDLIRNAEEMGIRTRIFSRRPGIDFGLIFQIGKQLKNDGINIVHTHNEAANFYGCIAGRMSKVPVIINTEHSRHYIDGLWRRRLEKRFLSFLTNKMVIVNEELKNISLSRDKISPSKLEVIVNGVDVEKFSQTTINEGEIIRANLGISLNAKVVIIVARLHPIKNHFLLFDAVQQIAREFASLIVLVVGDGEERTKLEGLAIKLGIQNNIIFLGVRTDIPQILKASNVMVLCSQTEGLPLVLLEGMSAKVPIIVTCGANKSGLINDRENGFVCTDTPSDLAKIISGIFSGTVDTSFVKANAYNTVLQCYSIQQTINKYEQLYLKYLETPC